MVYLQEKERKKRDEDFLKDKTLSSLMPIVFQYTHICTHTHTHTYIYILYGNNQTQCDNRLNSVHVRHIFYMPQRLKRNAKP